MLEERADAGLHSPLSNRVACRHCNNKYRVGNSTGCDNARMHEPNIVLKDNDLKVDHASPQPSPKWQCAPGSAVVTACDVGRSRDESFI